MCAVDVLTMCWPQKQLMPSCSWCNWRQYVENQVAVAPSYNLHSSTLCRIYLLASQSSLSSHIGLILSHTNPCECSVYCSMPVRRAMQVLLYHILSSVCMSFRGNKLNACCLLPCTRKVKNGLSSLLYTLAVWPHVQRRQHSSCYRYASVRVVMVAAQPEISSCYLWSAENAPFATTKHALPHPITWVQVTHEDCYFVFCPQMLPMSWHFPHTAKLNFTGTTQT